MVTIHIESTTTSLSYGNIKTKVSINLGQTEGIKSIKLQDRPYYQTDSDWITKDVYKLADIMVLWPLAGKLGIDLKLT